MTTRSRASVMLVCCSALAPLALAQDSPPPPKQPSPAARSPQQSRPTPPPPEAGSRERDGERGERQNQPPLPIFAENDMPIVRVVGLKNATTVDTMGVLRGILPAVGNAVIAPDDRTNSLIVMARTEQRATLVIDLIAQLDQPLPTATADQIDSLELTNCVAREAAVVVRELVSDREPRPMGRSELRIVPDERGNTLWFRGAAADVARAKETAARFDQVSSSRTGINPTNKVTLPLRVYALKYASSMEVAATLNQLLQAQRQVVFADPRSQTLLAACSEAEHARIAEVVKSLDVPPRDPKVSKEDASPRRSGND